MSNPETSAVAAYSGYEYQIVTTVWVALDLVIARAWCDSVEIEPASQEDLKADLNVPPEASDVVIGTASGSGPVEIQIKRRSRHWSVADFRKLLETSPRSGRGPAPRERALARLKAEGDLRYVLITDAEVDYRLKDFVVEQVGHSSPATDTSLVGLPAGVAARIGVCEKRVPKLVDHEIEEILERTARVPLQKVGDCRAALLERVRDRLLGRREARLGRDELEAVIAEHGGFPTSSGDDFVQPAVFDKLRRSLDEPPFALVLVGPPGIGKTRAAEQLVDEHRRAARPFEIADRLGPREIRAALSRPGRTLFYLEDPWGSYKLAQDAARWNDELPRLIWEANSDKRFLVTSRTAVLRESIDLSPEGREPERLKRRLGAPVVTILEADFDGAARREILRLRMRGATRWQRDWVEDRLARIVSNLTVPQALKAFAHGVRVRGSAAELNIDQLLAESQVAAIGTAVKQQVRELHEVAAGATLWAFLAVGEPITDALVEELAVWLGGDGADLPRLIELLTANGWLTPRDGVLTAHPTVIEGLEHLVDEERATVCRILPALFGVLVTNRHVGVATRLLHGLSGRHLPVPADVRASIEQHLCDAVLTGEGPQFPAALASLARVSSASDPLSLLARALEARTKARHGFGFDTWSPPTWTVAERTAVGGSADALRLARRYVEFGLGWSASFSCEEELVDFLLSFGWDLTEDFAAAAVGALGRGEGADGPLLGALAPPTPEWERLLEAALAAYDAVDRCFDEENVREQRRAVDEGELDAAYSAHLLDEPGERFHPSTSALDKIVAARRARESYGWLVSHPRRATLVRPWAESIPYDRGEVACDELRALLAAAESWNRPYVWQAIGRSRCQSLAPLLLDRLGNGPVDELTAVWGALIGMYEPHELSALAESTLATVGWSRRAAMVFAVRGARMPDRHDHLHREVEDHQRHIRDLLPSSEQSALDACFDAVTTKDGPASGLNADVLDAITATTDGPHELLAAGACLVLACNGRFANASTRRLLASEDKWVRLHALRAITETQPLDRAALASAFADPYYQCRRHAMFVLSEDASAEERASIIAMADDASAPVRAACARIIGEQQWTEGVTTLCALLNDERDLNEAGAIDATPEYHVARDAARALGEIPPPLSAPHLASALKFLREGRRACADVVVHRELLAVVGRQCDPALAPLIERLLRSGWRMGGENGSFPLRYAAAWCWVEHLLEFREDAPLLASVVLEAAEHSDGRLAAPALVALGTAWKHSPDAIRRVLANPETTDERCLLVEVGARVAGEPPPEEIIAPRLPQSCPGRRLMAWCWDIAEPDEAWCVRLGADQDVKLWIESIRASSPVNGALRALLLQSPRKHLLSVISNDRFRDDELTTGIRTISTFHFAGLE